MQRPASAWMRLTGSMALATLVSGCGIAVSGEAICDGLASDVTDHAAALAEDGGERSVETGVRLIRKFDAGCEF